MPCDKLQWMKKNTHVCVSESLCCAAEINTTL